MKKLKVGLIGYGYSGAIFHAPIIQAVEGLNIVSVVSSNPSKVYGQFPNVKIYSNPGEMWNDIDLVIITTPNATHYPLVMEALEAGKHVVVEKPFVNSVKEGQQLIQKAKEKNKLLSIYHNRRWDNDYIKLRSTLEQGEFGQIYYYGAHFNRFVPELREGWRENNISGSGILFDLGSHLIDQALQLFGFPDAVLADVLAQRPGSKTIDYFNIQLRYSTLRVVLQSRMMDRRSGPRFEIHGSRASMLLEGIDPQERMLVEGKTPNSSEWINTVPKNRGTFVIQSHSQDKEQDNSVILEPGTYKSYYEGIYRSIAFGEPLPVTAEEALDVIRIIEAAMESNRLGKSITTVK
jgi:scyllo-inositol 2-dehydrogenase (NADP+)